jgi:uncharacterized protein
VKRVFVDTGAFFALAAAEDAAHHALLLTRARDGRARALEFLAAIRSSRCRVERIRKADEASAFALLGSHDDKGYSFCDALSFVVMERLHIKEAIAFDRHFRQYGRFVIL